MKEKAELHRKFLPEFVPEVGPGYCYCPGTGGRGGWREEELNQVLHGEAPQGGLNLHSFYTIFDRNDTFFINYTPLSEVKLYPFSVFGSVE